MPSSALRISTCDDILASTSRNSHKKRSTQKYHCLFIFLFQVCLFADVDSPLIGLRNLVMPLRWAATWSLFSIHIQTLSLSVSVFLIYFSLFQSRYCLLLLLQLVLHQGLKLSLPWAEACGELMSYNQPIDSLFAITDSLIALSTKHVRTDICFILKLNHIRWL